MLAGDWIRGNYIQLKDKMDYVVHRAGDTFTFWYPNSIFAKLILSLILSDALLIRP